MKGKIAVFANGWGTEYLREVVTGVSEVAEPLGYDVFCFVNFSVMQDINKNNQGEMNIFKLPELSDFDGIILLANSFNTKAEELYVHEQVILSGVPTVSVEYEFDDITTIKTNNYFGMYELVTHMIEEHNVKEVVYIGGPKEHVESNIRLEATQKALNEHGISLQDDSIYYGDWGKLYPCTLIQDWIDKHNKLPEAIICANDIMAIGISNYLKDMGYKIPYDVKITGYDCTEYGQEYEPPISSVSHEWFSMGKKTFEVLIDKIKGVDIDEPEMMKTRFVCGASCGCSFNKYIARAQIQIGKSRRPEKLVGSECDSHFRHMYLAIRKVDNADNMHNSISDLYGHEHWMVGKNFMLCLEPDIYDVETPEETLVSNGYSQYMDVICYLRNGVPQSRTMMGLNDIIFSFCNETEEASTYIFVPLSNESKNLGFAVLNRNVDIVLDYNLFSWTRHIIQYLEQFRQNITISNLTKKLTELSVTDMLTGVYNRAGCERIAYPMLTQYYNDGLTGVVMIADIDRMKMINDVYGHANGDLALKTIAFVLKSELPSDWIVSRFGGDEFFIGGKLEEGLDLDRIIDRITDRLECEKKRRKIDFNLTVSIGYSVIRPENDINVEKTLMEADKIMYFIKKCHHDEADKNLQA